MKYNSSNVPLKCMMTNSTCFKGTRSMDIKGILWHSTGANNPNLKRYVQPSENDTNYKYSTKESSVNDSVINKSTNELKINYKKLPEIPMIDIKKKIKN